MTISLSALGSNQHLTTETHEEQVQIYRGSAADEEGKSFHLFYFLRTLFGFQALDSSVLPHPAGIFLTEVAARQTRAG